MRAARCLRYGSPDVLVVEEVPDPVAGEGQVVVDVAAAAVNFPDVLLVADQYQIHVPSPFTPGSEFAGTVRAVGPGVTRWPSVTGSWGPPWSARSPSRSRFRPLARSGP